MSWNRDLTLDEALSDPMIGAVLRADGVDPRQFETLLRSTARRLEARPPASRAAPLPPFAKQDQVRFCRRPAIESCRAW